MVREVSAGGVVLREISGVCNIALIEPRKEESPGRSDRKRSNAVLALPKGLVDPGEKPPATAVREVLEETGVTARVIEKLADIKYMYVRTWGDGERVFKIVTFYLLAYEAGQIGDIAPEMGIEVKRALWVPLEEAPGQLAYGNERKVLRLARDYLESHSGVTHALARKSKE